MVCGDRVMESDGVIESNNDGGDEVITCDGVMGTDGM